MTENDSPFGMNLGYVNVNEFPGLKVGDVIKIVPGRLSNEIAVGEFVLISMSEEAEDQLSFKVADEIAVISSSSDEVGARVSHVTDEAVTLEVLSAHENGGR
ncbi:hypothetical protein [Paeniglutamicibacter kerguelensis]|uniref:Transcription antitermination factor NusG n=1 Tax=Paeniglutamicibacter kerguelensis TaxID=254788 RepID=A0ABS4XC01_9MICC|nr:hypothetical protein [Paeniglutamicibacter kerguelensis]MBP2385997.1 transcription antitermination factor NusG [Paeniglutamicibacter kerguelensis]